MSPELLRTLITCAEVGLWATDTDVLPNELCVCTW